MWTWEQPVGSIPPGFSFSSSLNSCPDFTNDGLWPASGSQSQINPFFPKLLLKGHCSITTTECKWVQYVSSTSLRSSVLSGQWAHLPDIPSVQGTGRQWWSVSQPPTVAEHEGVTAVNSWEQPHDRKSSVATRALRHSVSLNGEQKQFCNQPVSERYKDTPVFEWDSYSGRDQTLRGIFSLLPWGCAWAFSEPSVIFTPLFPLSHNFQVSSGSIDWTGFL